MNILCPHCGDEIKDIVALVLAGMNTPDLACNSCLEYLTGKW